MTKRMARRKRERPSPPPLPPPLPATPHRAYQPILTDGIPNLDPESKSYDDYWNQVWDWCLNGYQPPGHSKISGKYFFHLNFWKISRQPFVFDGRVSANKIVALPLYRRFDHEFSEHLEGCLADGVNCIVGKFRRAGVTDICMSWLAHDLLFYPKNQSAFAVPEEKYQLLTMPKLYTGLQYLPKEIYQNMLYDNAEQMQFGFIHKDEMGNEVVGGSQSILFKKIFTKAGVLKGSWLKTLLIDEVGEFSRKPTLRQAYWESVDCVQEAGRQNGIIILAGTSDKINNPTADYEVMWYEPEAFNLRPFFIPDTKWHYVSKQNKDGHYAFDFTTGESLEQEASEDIDHHIQLLSQLPDKTDLYKYMQNHPRTPGDMFIVTTEGSLDIIRVNERIRAISDDPMAKNFVQHGRLEEDDGEAYKVTGGIRFVPDQSGRFHITLHPINHLYRQADIIGVDDYQKDKTNSSPSKGAIVVYRRYIGADQPCKIPVMTYWYRPPSLREFYSDVLKAARYYSAEVAFEMNVNQAELSPPYEFFKSKNALGYLKRYPLVMGKIVRPAEAFGYQVRGSEIAITDLKLNDFISSPEINNVYDIQFLNQLAICGRPNTNTDIISAFRICLLYDQDMSYRPATKVMSNEDLIQSNVLPDDRHVRKPITSFSFGIKNGKPAPNFTSPHKGKFIWQDLLRRRYGMTK